MVWIGLENRFLIHFATIFATSSTNFATCKKMKPMFASQRRIREFLLDEFCFQEQPRPAFKVQAGASFLYIEHEFRALCPYSIVVGYDGELAA